RDLIWSAEPAERNAVGDGLHDLLSTFYRAPRRRVRITWADRVYPNAPTLQIRCPCPRERTHGSFCGAINTPLRRSCTGDDRRIQDDRGTVRHERKRLLYRKEEALHIRVKKRVVMFLSDLVQGSELRETGIRENNVELPFLSLDLCEEAIKIVRG